jgi:hypothetical protein
VSAIPAILASIPDVLAPIAPVFQSITNILAPVANVFETVAQSTVVARVAAVLEAIKPVFAPVHHVLTPVAAIFTAIPHVFDSIAGDRPAASRALREQRSRADDREERSNGQRMQGDSWRTHNEQPPVSFLLPGW